MFIVDVPALKVVADLRNKVVEAAAVRVTVEALSVVVAEPPLATPIKVLIPTEGFVSVVMLDLKVLTVIA